MAEWLTPLVAVVLMYTGVVPSLANVYLLFGDRHKPGVLWFLVLMAVAGFWALLFATFTLVRSPALTLALANVFWAVVPTAAVATFLLAYEYVFRTVASRRLVVALFAPVATLFVLSWFNPGNLVFTPAYHVDANGFLYAPPLGGPVKILVTKVYGYFLTMFAAGMFVGEALRTKGARRWQTLSLLFILTVLAATTLIKITGLVPEYFDPTSVAYSVSGLAFTYSIDRHGLLKFGPIAREEAFETVTDVILVVEPDGTVVDLNRSGRDLLGDDVVGEPLGAVLPDPSGDDRDDAIPTVRLDEAGDPRYFAWRTSTVTYGRGLTGRLVILSDITALQHRQDELDLLRQVLTRIFRHNMRNDLNIIRGHASNIREREDGAVADMADTIHARAGRLLNESEKARAIERVFETEAPACRSLRTEVDRVLESYTPRSDVVVRSSVEDVTVEVHPQFDLALEELIENAITHHDGPGVPEVDISSQLTDDGVVLIVEDDGPGIPNLEIEVLDAGEETSLKHSAGIGLWLVEMIVTRTDGRLEIHPGSDGTRVEVHLRRGDEASRAS